MRLGIDAQERVHPQEQAPGELRPQSPGQQFAQQVQSSSQHTAEHSYFPKVDHGSATFNPALARSSSFRGVAALGDWAGRQAICPVRAGRPLARDRGGAARGVWTVGAAAALVRATQGAGVLNTAYIERVNATFCAHLACLGRRSRHLARRPATLTAELYLVGRACNFCTTHPSRPQMDQ